VLYFDVFSWLIFDGCVKNNALTYKDILPLGSLVSPKTTEIIKLGNKIKTTSADIKIYKGNKFIGRLKKQGESGGLIIDFK